MVDRLGVEKDVPVDKAVPPVAAEYQVIVPALAVACNVTDPVPQCAAPVVLVMVGISSISAVTGDLDAVVQPVVASVDDT